MSGIYISGMEMPNSCSDCFAELCIGSDFGCGIIDFDDANTTCFTRKRRKDCPLIEVSDHGRLIDADAIPWIETKTIEDNMPVSILIKEQLESVPIIIPADKDGANDV